jgi:phosphoglycerate dehydrogenase-like enzyme
MRLAIINDYQKLAIETAAWNQLPADIEIEVFQDRLSDGAEAARRLAPYDIVVTAREETRFDRTLVEQLPNLKLLVTHGQRNAALDLDALTEHGVTVETAWGLILSLAKHIPLEDRGVREGKWGLDLPRGLTGKTLGVLGLGRLGGGVAKVGLALDMEVIAWRQNLTDARCAELGVIRVDKDALFERSDVVSVHVVLGDRTRGLVGAREIGLMKPTAWLINTSRGPIVDEAALIEALETNRIAGAGLDVYDVEPLPADHKLRTLPNTVLTPHIGGRTYENFAARYQESLEDVLAWLDGNPIRVIAAPD